MGAWLLVGVVIIGWVICRWSIWDMWLVGRASREGWYWAWLSVDVVISGHDLWGRSKDPMFVWSNGGLPPSVGSLCPCTPYGGEGAHALPYTQMSLSALLVPKCLRAWEALWTGQGGPGLQDLPRSPEGPGHSTPLPGPTQNLMGRPVGWPRARPARPRCSLWGRDLGALPG